MANTVLETTKSIVTTLLLVFGVLIFAIGVLGGFVPAIATVFGVVVPTGLGLLGSVAVLALVAIAAGFLNSFID